MAQSRYKKVLIPVAIVAVAIVVMLLLSSLRPSPQKSEPVSVNRLVEVIVARRSEHQFELSSQGTLLPMTETDLVAEVAGKVVWVAPNFVAGGFFSAGEPLLRIDPSDYEAQLKQAQAALAGRQAQLALEQAQAQQAALDWGKLDSRKGAKAPSLVLREPQLAEAEANVKAAEAEVDRAQRNLQRTVLDVPYTGIVRSRDADLGQFLAAGSPVGTTFAVDRSEVRLPLSTDELAFVNLPAPGAPETAQLSPVSLKARLAGRDVVRNASLVRSEQVIDQTNRMVFMVAQLIDPYGLNLEADPSPTQGLEPFPMGTFVSARISGRQAGAVFELPREVVTRDQRVLVVGAENLLELRPVTVLQSDADFVYVSEGLNDGDQIITTAIEAPIPGTQLTVINPTPAPDSSGVTEAKLAPAQISGETP